MVTLIVLACAGGAGDKAVEDSQAEVTVDRGPTTIALDADPNGLWWDADEAALYIADDNGNRALRWSDAGGLSLAATFPEAPADGPGLGQLVRLADGALVVTRFGYGTAGDVVFVGADGVSGVVPGLDPERRRIGLTLTDEGTLFDGWYKSADGTRVGGVSALDLTRGETDLWSDLGKPVGVLAHEGRLWVADQDKLQLLTAPLDDLSDLSLLAELDSADLLCAGPMGGVFMGGKDGAVRLISAEGVVEVYASGFQEARGVAYDAQNGRLFVADHDGEEADGLTHRLQIVPVAP